MHAHIKADDAPDISHPISNIDLNTIVSMFTSVTISLRMFACTSHYHTLALAHISPTHGIYRLTSHHHRKTREEHPQSDHDAPRNVSAIYLRVRDIVRQKTREAWCEIQRIRPEFGEECVQCGESAEHSTYSEKRCSGDCAGQEEE
jgi:hypothetical protein